MERTSEGLKLSKEWKQATIYPHRFNQRIDNSWDDERSAIDPNLVSGSSSVLTHLRGRKQLNMQTAS